MVSSLVNSENTLKNSNKCLIVDDEVAPNKLKREIFVNTFSLSDFKLPLECCIFVHNYEEALRTIETRQDLVFCFLDYRIPKNATSPEEKSADDPDFVEWGVELINSIEFPISIYSAIVSQDNLKKQALQHPHIVYASKKPFTLDSTIPLPNKITSKQLLIETYLRSLFENNLSNFTEVDNASSFDYASLDEETSSFVLNKTKEIKRLARRAVEDSINIGLYLTEIKEKLGHGNFLKWLKFEFSEFKPSHAATLMRTAERFKDVNFTYLDIVPSALYELSRSNVPDKAVEEVLDRARKGEKISNKVAKAVKLRYREQEHNNLDKFTKNSSEKKSKVIEDEVNEPQSKDRRVKTTEESSSKTAPPPLLLSPEQQASLEKKIARSQLQIIKVQHNVLENSFWQLGKSHRLFCGKPTNSFFLKQIPKKIALSIGFPPNNNLDLIPSIETRATHIFSYDYEDMDLSGIEEMLEIAIDLSVGENNNVVFSYVSHFPVLDLAVRMGCNCYVAEPDLVKCDEIIQFWKKESFVRRLSNDPVT